MESNGLFAPILVQHQDVFRPTVTQDNSIAVLFNPVSDDFILGKDVLYYKAKALSIVEVFALAANLAINNPIYFNTLVHGLFTHLFLCYDLRNCTEFVLSKKEILYHLGIDDGKKRVNLVKMLAELSQVYGVIKGLGVFPLLTFEVLPETLVIHSEYMHHILNSILVEAPLDCLERGCYYTDKVLLNIVANPSQIACLIIIELISLLAQSGDKEVEISVSTLAVRIPQLRRLLESSSSTSLKNQKLKWIFSTVYRLLHDQSIISSKYKELSFEPVIPEVSNLDVVLKLNLKRTI